MNGRLRYVLFLYYHFLQPSSSLPALIAPTAPAGNYTRVSGRDLDRGPFEPLFITSANTDWESLISIRVSQLEEFLRSKKGEHQWPNIHAALDLYRNETPQDPLPRIVCIQEGLVVPIDTLPPGPYWIEVSILLGQCCFRSMLTYLSS